MRPVSLQGSFVHAVVFEEKRGMAVVSPLEALCTPPRAVSLTFGEPQCFSREPSMGHAKGERLLVCTSPRGGLPEAFTYSPPLQQASKRCSQHASTRHGTSENLDDSGSVVVVDDDDNDDDDDDDDDDDANHVDNGNN